MWQVILAIIGIALLINFWYIILPILAICFVVSLLNKQDNQSLNWKTSSHRYQEKTHMSYNHHSCTQNDKVMYCDNEIELFGYKLEKSFLYTSNSKNSEHSFAITTKSTPNFVTNDNSNLGYWPSYSNLNASQKGQFIKWLASGKKDPDIDIGYVYIYFYGLEYRALIEKQDEKEILFEVIHLCSIYPRLWYGLNLAAYLILKINTFADDEKVFISDFLTKRHQEYIHSEYYNSLIRKIRGTGYGEIKIQPYQFLSNDEYLGLSNRQTELLNFYLSELTKTMDKAELYELKNKTFSYHIAMANYYSNTNNVPYEAICPSTKLKRQWNAGRKTLQENKKNLIKKFDSSSSELNLVEKYAFLPPALREKIEQPIFLSDENIGIKSISEILEKFELPIQEKKLTQRQSDFIAEAVEVLGYIIEPDSRLSKQAYKPDMKANIFKNELRSQNIVSESYIMPSIMLDLGFKIALEDNELLESEINYIKNFLYERFPLTQIDRIRLDKRIELLTRTREIGTNDLIKRLLSDNKNLEMISKFLISTAAADGIVKPVEYILLKKLFKQLDLTEEYLNNLLTELSSEDESVIIQKSTGTQKRGSKIPEAPTENKEHIEFILDKEKLLNIMIDTSHVKKTLQDIFADENADNIEPQANEDKIDVAVNLPKVYLDIIDVLITNAEWSSAEMMNMVQNKGLMLNSVIDKINEWSDEEFGDFLIEEDENLYLINQDVVKFLENRSVCCG